MQAHTQSDVHIVAILLRFAATILTQPLRSQWARCAQRHRWTRRSSWMAARPTTSTIATSRTCPPRKGFYFPMRVCLWILAPATSCWPMQTTPASGRSNSWGPSWRWVPRISSSRVILTARFARTADRSTHNDHDAPAPPTTPKRLKNFFAVCCNLHSKSWSKIWHQLLWIQPDSSFWSRTVSKCPKTYLYTQTYFEDSFELAKIILDRAELQQLKTSYM